MKKIGIVSIYGNENFGNKLQSYAMCKILSNYGTVQNLKIYHLSEEKNIFQLIYKNKMLELKFIIKQILLRQFTYHRHINFIRFDKKLPNYKRLLTKNFKYDILNKKFDYFVCGSDQVWNPTLYPNMYVNMLGFTSKEKKIAVSPSVSMDELTLAQEDMFRALLSDFEHLSCREEQGAKLIQQITGKNVISLVDPTLMLPQKEWNKIICKPKFHEENKKYVLLYFLGEMSEEYKTIVRQISEKYRLEVINILDKKSKYYSCGPSEFVYLIKNCTIMLTDSFHGSVFSIIYNVDFHAIGNMNRGLSRMMSLLKSFGLESRLLSESSLEKAEFAEIDWSSVNLKKSELKEMSVYFLQNALK